MILFLMIGCLISFYGKVTFLVDKGKAVNLDFCLAHTAVYLDIGEVFDIVPYSMVLEKPTAPGFSGCSVHVLDVLDKKLCGWPGPERGGEWN